MRLMLMGASSELAKRLKVKIKGFALKMALGNRHDVTLASDGTYVYSFAGQLNGSLSSALHRYDPKTDIWTPLTPGPISRSQHSAAIIDGKMYVFGTSNNLNRFDCYDIATDTWSTIPTTQVGRAYPNMVAHDGKLYLCGGWNGLSIRTLHRFDPATGTWTELSQMVTGVYGAAIVAHGSKIYVAGGFTASSTISQVQVYDITTNTWSTLAELPAAKTYCEMCAIGDKLYLFLATNRIFSYNIANNTWEIETPSFFKYIDYTNAGVCELDGVAYLIGNGNYFTAYGPS